MHLKTVVERFLGGQIQPADVPGILAWMGITPDVAGDDAYSYQWAKEYAGRGGAKAAAPGRAR
jgi:toluene monooxygenase system protein A